MDAEGTQIGKRRGKADMIAEINRAAHGEIGYLDQVIATQLIQILKDTALKRIAKRHVRKANDYFITDGPM
jgi:hypothetical protein